MLEHVYSPVRGPWTLELEKEFQAARSLENELFAFGTDPKKRAELELSSPEKNWQTVSTRYYLLRLARLFHYLRVRRPDANVGWSILIYRLTAEEIHAATGGSLDDWRRLIERTVTAKSQ